jgi:mRNA interferase RelE/StbE
MYKIELRRRTQRVLDKLPNKDFQSILEAINGLAEIPRPRGIERIKNTIFWRIRQGDYRIIYYIDDKEQLITILRIGHRREIYRQLKE